MYEEKITYEYDSVGSVLYIEEIRHDSIPNKFTEWIKATLTL
jgi:hypothetical protein